ncbi:MAG: nucleotidyl transferase AbiEii/AbiGii toxin family protein [Candidatus Levybacteria bacterium]|nr:nucleotidyl transferase AbiEii/AbiGii toxin family protein [Candidatus Levybacteria bacterium]
MHQEILLPQTRKLLSQINSQSLPRGFFLAGGTAVALHLGHRRSADLDFFTPTEFVETQWAEKLKKDFGFKLLKRDWQTLIGYVGKVKISLFSYGYKKIASPKFYNQVPVASLPDLAAIKLDTIIGRGTKRDLIDIYFLAQKFTLKKLLAFYQKKYDNLEEREIMIKKALVFFDDADKDEEPDMIVSLDWAKTKKWFTDEVKSLS